MNESDAFGLLRSPADAPPPPRWNGGPDGPVSAALGALGAPDTRLEQVLEVLGRVDLPGGVCETLRRELRRTLASATVKKVAVWAQRVLCLPWWERSPARFAAADMSLALERAHGGHVRARSRLVEALGTCPQSTGLVTVEGARDGRGVAAAGSPLTLVVRPAAAAAPVPCPAGPSGVGKTSLAVAAATALGRPHVRVMLDGQDAGRLLHGATEDGGYGRIIAGLCKVGVNNPVFLLEGIDQVDAEAAGVLLDVLEPQRRRAFEDAYAEVPVRPVRRAVDRDGDRCGPDPRAGAQGAGGDRPVGVRHGGEAGHRATASADAAVRRACGGELGCRRRRRR
ncbi:MAG: AAA domain-containing protein [Boseongicola sp. SB0677_bin_26]|nr:AAA domain-containing protein [Boseongicola sp. SB0677_bin_26]